MFDFHNWIIENDLEPFEAALREQDLDSVDVLVDLTAKDLTTLGIKTLGGQKKMLNAIQKLKNLEHTDTYSDGTELIKNDASVSNRCPRCGEIWGKQSENAGIANTLGKAVVGSLLLGPIGAIGGAAFGNKTIVYECRKCGFTKRYKTSSWKSLIKR